MRFAELCEHGQVPRPCVAEAEVCALDEGDRAVLIDDLLNKGLRGQAEQFGVGLKDQHLVRAGGLEPVELLIKRAQAWGLLGGVEGGVWVGIEGHRQDFGLVRLGQLASGAEDRAVSEVDAVESADGDDGGFGHGLKG